MSTLPAAQRAASTQPVSASPSRAPPSASQSRTWLLFSFAFAFVAVGFVLPTQRYVTPETSWGYWLGIAGTSAMVALLIYPLRKRSPSLAFLGSIKVWFQIHMLLGVFGPILILYHCNFSLGAVNSNVALISMLVVAGSGWIGRYLYTGIHRGLYGSRLSLSELQGNVLQLHRQSAGWVRSEPVLVRLREYERRVEATSGHFAGPAWTLVAGSCLVVMARIHLARDIRVLGGLLGAGQQRQLSQHVLARLTAVWHAARFHSYERLFALWHLFHLPLFVVMVLATTAHIVAVHVY